jgi:hypothetical protein
MYIELGVAFAKQAVSSDIKIYIIGDQGSRSLMQLHPSIIHVDNLEDVFNMEKIEYKEFNITF